VSPSTQQTHCSPEICPLHASLENSSQELSFQQEKELEWCAQSPLSEPASNMPSPSEGDADHPAAPEDGRIQTEKKQSNPETFDPVILRLRPCVAGSPSPPATNSTAGQSGQVPPADPEDADSGHAADTAAEDSDVISGAPGPAPAEQESELAESAAGGMGDIPDQNMTTIEEEVELNSGYSCGE
jgi:hypothetical protein